MSVCSNFFWWHLFSSSFQNLPTFFKKDSISRTLSIRNIFCSEITESMEVYLDVCIKSLDMDMLKKFRKLGAIFYHKHWDSIDSTSVSRESLIWLWETLVLTLCFNRDLPVDVRFLEQEKFIRDMRNFLSFCYEFKEGLRFKIDEKVYLFFSHEFNVFQLWFTEEVYIFLIPNFSHYNFKYMNLTFIILTLVICWVLQHMILTVWFVILQKYGNVSLMLW